ncbi:hypothetical protein AV530_002242 [Patagioenas fasciata monilis]|uniref:Uncharacterized protein n=1 Tax=Patagioenas fasciata monilis TaxID=372326 RepID=A0A1V4K5X4_PATFA|nr:hypothetical protein AV530_002242 [Patagioenas fasciata monilis]
MQTFVEVDSLILVIQLEQYSCHKRLSVMIEAIYTEGLALCPCCTSFESTENESSTLKRMELKYGCTLTKELE